MKNYNNYVDVEEMYCNQIECDTGVEKFVENIAEMSAKWNDDNINIFLMNVYRNILNNIDMILSSTIKCTLCEEDSQYIATRLFFDYKEKFLEIIEELEEKDK